MKDNEEKLNEENWWSLEKYIKMIKRWFSAIGSRIVRSTRCNHKIILEMGLCQIEPLSTYDQNS
jgi:hypothetical protein